MRTAKKVSRSRCYRCFGKLNPQDPEPALRSFVECRQCHMRYHKQHVSQKGCLNCGNQIFDPITLSRPLPVWTRAKRRAVPVKPSAAIKSQSTSRSAPNTPVELLLIMLMIAVILSVVIVLRPT